jgi:hypothetical protein
MQKEILLIRKVFTSRHFYETRDNLNESTVSKKDQLLVAYNNLLLNLMPEISEQNSADKKLYLCKLTESLLLLELKFGETMLELDLKSSIDPYSFMAMQILS